MAQMSIITQNNGDSKMFWHVCVAFVANCVLTPQAVVMEDEAYVTKCDRWLTAGTAALETHLWNADAKSYFNFNEPETKQVSDYVFGYQLDGQCECADDNFSFSGWSQSYIMTLHGRDKHTIQN